MTKRWETKKLSEVCEIKPSKSEAKSKLKSDDFVTFLPMEDLGVMVKEISPVKEKKLKDVVGGYTYFAENDVLLAKITPCFENGKVGIARNLKNGIGFGSSEFIVFRDQGEVLPEYLFYFLSRERFRDEGKKAMTGAVGHKRVSKDFIENYLIPFPISLSEQKSIVATLDEVFATIDKAKTNTEKNLQNAKELFESYLQNIFVNPDEDWEEKRLEEVCIDLLQGINTATDKTKFIAEGIPILQAKEIGDDKLELEKCKYVSNEYFQSRTERYKPKNGDILFNNIGSSLGRSIVVDWKFSFTIAWNVMRIIPQKDIIMPAYLNYLFKSPVINKLILDKSRGVGMPFISKKDFSQVIFFVPKIEEQKIIVKKIDTLFAETRKLENIYKKKLDDLEELKKSILQKAFSGELAVATKNLVA